jgi:hypothetical protein
MERNSLDAVFQAFCLRAESVAGLTSNLSFRTNQKIATIYPDRVCYWILGQFRCRPPGDGMEVTNDIKPAGPLRQGDILRWDRRDGTVWTEYGVVVTADCDLEHNKMRNWVSYVPLVRFESYVSDVWGPDYVEKKVSKILESAVSTIRSAHAETKPGATLTASAVADWINRDDPSGIASAIFGKNCSDKVRLPFEKIIARAKAALNCQNELSARTGELDPYIKRITIRASQLFPDGKGSAQTIKEALNGHCGSLPGDVFFIGAIPGEGNDGYFALLRHVTQCSLDDISLDPAQRPGPVLPLRRIAKLQPPFVFAMTQQLAKVFSDIGLPASYAERMTTCVKKYLS